MKNNYLKIWAFILLGTLALASCESKAQEGENKTVAIAEQNPVQDSVQIEPEPEPEPEIVKEATDEPNMKYLYLTWDDGPNEGTENVIKAFKKHNIPVTFFIIARNIHQANNGKKHYEIEVNDPLFQVANHSFNHANNRYKTFYANPSGVVADFKKASDTIKVDKLIGRTPGRNIWRTKNIRSTDLVASTAAGDALYENGYQMIGWDVEWQYNKQTKGVRQSAQDMMNSIDYAFNSKNSKIPNHVVLLTHDQYFRDSYSLEQLDLFLSTLNERKDIEVRLMDDYPELRPSVMEQ